MQISDIQPVKQGISEMYKVTFADEEGYDCAEVIMSRNDMWQIAKYCQSELSLAAQRKKKF